VLLGIVLAIQEGKRI